MNRGWFGIILGIGVVAMLAGLDFGRRQAAERNAERSVRRLHLESQLSNCLERAGRWKAQAQVELEERERIRGEAVAEATAPATHPQPLAADPEGAFPAGRPYFHLPKSRLDAFVFEPFEDGAVHPAAAVLLGLNASEEAELRAAYAALRTALEVEESRQFEWIAPPPPSTGQTQRIVIGRIPALPEFSLALRESFYERVTAVLGAERAGHFLRRAEAGFDSDLHGLGSMARAFVVEDPGGPQPVLLVEYERNGERWIDKVAWPIPEAWWISPFAHLFGDRMPRMAGGVEARVRSTGKGEVE